MLGHWYIPLFQTDAPVETGPKDTDNGSAGACNYREERERAVRFRNAEVMNYAFAAAMSGVLDG